MTCINCDGLGSEHCDHYGCEDENKVGEEE